MTLRAVSFATPVTTEQVAIGHDILSLISSAMYVEPMIIYRELIQNAADAIDDAIELGVLKPGQGRAALAVDPLHRHVVMRDNGIGVSNYRFVETISVRDRLESEARPEGARISGYRTARRPRICSGTSAALTVESDRTCQGSGLGCSPSTRPVAHVSVGAA